MSQELFLKLQTKPQQKKSVEDLEFKCWKMLEHLKSHHPPLALADLADRAAQASPSGQSVDQMSAALRDNDVADSTHLGCPWVGRWVFFVGKCWEHLDTGNHRIFPVMGMTYIAYRFSMVFTLTHLTPIGWVLLCLFFSPATQGTQSLR